jgi:Domain of unknown function (DU1801)
MRKRHDRPRTFADPRVAAVFDRYPDRLRQKLLFLRELIFDTASTIEGVGKLEETLRWGEPSYLTPESGSGSTLRIKTRGVPGQYAMYFHCQTNLIEMFRERYPDRFRFEKNRAIIFQEGEAVPVAALRHCITLALTYHRNGARADGGKRRRARPGK